MAETLGHPVLFRVQIDQKIQIERKCCFVARFVIFDRLMNVGNKRAYERSEKQVYHRFPSSRLQKNIIRNKLIKFKRKSIKF